MYRHAQKVAEHSLFKAASPLVFAALIGSITWIFVTVMDLDKLLHRVEYSEIPQISTKLQNVNKTLEELDTQVTNLRIKFAELASPGHPAHRLRDRIPYYPHGGKE